MESTSSSSARVIRQTQLGVATGDPPIPVLTLEPGPNAIPLNLKQLVRSRMLIQASSGGGKSRAVRYLLELTHGKIQQLVIDPEGEYGTLREAFPFIVAGRDGDVPADPTTAGLLCRRLMGLNVSAVLDLYDLAPGERRRFVRLFLEELLNLPRSDWHPVLVAIDEAHVYCPERGKGEAESTEAVITLCTQGRKRGLAPILATQRLAKLHKDAAAELFNKLIGLTSLDDDILRAGNELGFGCPLGEAAAPGAAQPGARYLLCVWAGDRPRSGVAAHRRRADHASRAGPARAAHAPTARRHSCRDRAAAGSAPGRRRGSARSRHRPGGDCRAAPAAAIPAACQSESRARPGRD